MPQKVDDGYVLYLYDPFDDVLYIEYDPKTNSFYDQCGFHISNILELVTPNDLLLFRKDPINHSWFRHRSMKSIVCKINMNGVEDDVYEEYPISDCYSADGSRCQFSDNSQGSREEICRYCRS